MSSIFGAWIVALIGDRSGLVTTVVNVLPGYGERGGGGDVARCVSYLAYESYMHIS